jgi:hypothetical protein
MRPRGGDTMPAGIPSINEMLQYTIAPTERDGSPIDRTKLLNELARLVRVRADLAAKAVQVNDTKAAAVQIAFAQLYLGLIESIRKGKFD